MPQPANNSIPSNLGAQPLPLSAPSQVQRLPVSCSSFTLSKQRFIPTPLGMLVGMAIAPTVNTSATFTTVPPTQIRFELAATPENSLSATPAFEGHSADLHPDVDQDTLIHVLQSQKVLNPVIAELQSQNIDLTYNRLAQGLAIAPLENGRLEVRYQHSDPQVAEEVVEHLAQAYTTYRQGCHTSACYVLPELERNAKLTAARLEQAKQELTALENQVNGQTLDQDVQWATNRSIELESYITQVQEDIHLTHQRYEEVRSRLSAHTIPTAQDLLRQKPAYQRLLQDLRVIEYQLAIQQMDPYADSERLRGLLNQHQKISSQLSQELNNTIYEVTTALQSSYLSISSESAAEFVETTSPSEINGVVLDQVGQSIQWAHSLNVMEQRQQALVSVYELLQRHEAALIRRVRDRDELKHEIYTEQQVLAQYNHQRQQLQHEVRQAAIAWQLVAPPEQIMS